MADDDFLLPQESTLVENSPLSNSINPSLNQWAIETDLKPSEIMARLSQAVSSSEDSKFIDFSKPYRGILNQSDFKIYATDRRILWILSPVANTPMFFIKGQIIQNDKNKSLINLSIEINRYYIFLGVVGAILVTLFYPINLYIKTIMLLTIPVVAFGFEFFLKQLARKKVYEIKNIILQKFDLITYEEKQKVNWLQVAMIMGFCTASALLIVHLYNSHLIHF